MTKTAPETTGPQQPEAPKLPTEAKIKKMGKTAAVKILGELEAKLASPEGVELKAALEMAQVMDQLRGRVTALEAKSRERWESEKKKIQDEIAGLNDRLNKLDQKEKDGTTSLEAVAGELCRKEGYIEQANDFLATLGERKRQIEEGETFLEEERVRSLAEINRLYELAIQRAKERAREERVALMEEVLRSAKVLTKDKADIEEGQAVRRVRVEALLEQRQAILDREAALKAEKKAIPGEREELQSQAAALAAQLDALVGNPPLSVLTPKMGISPLAIEVPDAVELIKIKTPVPVPPVDVPADEPDVTTPISVSPVAVPASEPAAAPAPAAPAPAAPAKAPSRFVAAMPKAAAPKAQAGAPVVPQDSPTPAPAAPEVNLEESLAALVGEFNSLYQEAANADDQAFEDGRNGFKARTRSILTEVDRFLVGVRPALKWSDEQRGKLRKLRTAAESFYDELN